MKILRNLKIKRSIRKAIRDKNSSGIIENYEYELNRVTRILYVKSQNPNDWKIVAKLSGPDTRARTDKMIFVGCGDVYSLNIHDPNFKLLNKKDIANGVFKEKDTRFAMKMFYFLSDGYRKGR